MTVIMRLKDGYVETEGSKLRIGNGRIERRWSFAGGLPASVSIFDKTRRREWIGPEASAAQFDCPMLPANAAMLSAVVSACEDHDFGIAAPHLRADIDMSFAGAKRIVRLTVRVYPSASFMRHELCWLPEGQAAAAAGTAIAIPRAAGEGGASAELRLDDNNNRQSPDIRDHLERLELREPHCSWEAVCFRDQTDTNNNLVGRESGLLYGNDKRHVRGNMLLLKQSLQDCGLLLVKESATPLGHLRDRGADFGFRGLTLSVVGSGIGAEDLAAQAEEIPSYGVAVGVFDGSTYGAYRLIRDYHRQIRVHRPERDSFVMSNTWGDRSRDGRITERFLLAELSAAARLGVDIMQIDDGWQKGVTSNSVRAQAEGGRWSDYYSGGGDFWSVHPERLPRGLAPIAELAGRLGIRLGLWYSPDSANDYANWEKDVGTLLRLHREHSIAAFKLDGIDIRSKIGEARLLNMMRQVVEATGGRVDFNLDTTAQERLGYFGKTQYGNIFLENRYTDWKSYYPHYTLRNLWSLAPYVPAAKLQMEFLNVNRNRERYGEDPLAPGACGQVYAYAVTAFANPLAWMELTGLDESQVGMLSAAIRAVKPHHKNILAGHVLPIGEEPNGTRWTGLQSISDEKSGYLLIIRERHPSPTCALKLWGAEGRGAAAAAPGLRLSEIVRMDKRDEVTASPDGPPVIVEPNASGNYEFARPAAFTFAIYRYEYARLS